MALKRRTYTWPSEQAQRVEGHGGRDTAFSVSQGETAGSADLCGSSKYSNEKFED